VCICNDYALFSVHFCAFIVNAFALVLFLRFAKMLSIVCVCILARSASSTCIRYICMGLVFLLFLYIFFFSSLCVPVFALKQKRLNYLKVARAPFALPFLRFFFIMLLLLLQKRVPITSWFCILYSLFFIYSFLSLNVILATCCPFGPIDLSLLTRQQSLPRHRNRAARPPPCHTPFLETGHRVNYDITRRMLLFSVYFLYLSSCWPLAGNNQQHVAAWSRALLISSGEQVSVFGVCLLRNTYLSAGICVYSRLAYAILMALYRLAKVSTTITDEMVPNQRHS